MLNHWSIVLLLCMQWMFKEIHGDSFCDSTPGKPVVKICQDNHVTNTEVVYVDSGGAPKLQKVTDCRCVIQSMSPGIMWIIELVNTEHLKDDMVFTVGTSMLLDQLTASGIVNLMYSKLNNSSVGGGCVKITTDVLSASNQPKFSVRCETNKLTNAKGTAALSNESGPESGSDVTLIASAVGGGLAVIAVVVVVSVFIIWRRRRNINDPDPPERASKPEQYEDTTNYGMQPNPAYEQFEGGKLNKSGAEHVYEENYAVPDDTQLSDRNKKSEYDYATCQSSQSSYNTSAQLEQNLTDNTYDHTTAKCTSAGSKGASENEYNHLPPSVTQTAELDNYNTLNDINAESTVTHSDSEYNVLNHSRPAFNSSSYRGNP